MPQVQVRLKAGDNWVDITDDVLIEGGVSVRWGASDGESSNRSPSSCSITLRNHHGRYSPMNPASDLYEYLGRDTEIEILFDGSLRFRGWANSWMPKWGVSEADHRVEVDIFGVRQRLGANPLPLNTALERGVPQLDGVVGYWPLTGGKYTRTYPDITGYCGDAVPEPWRPNPYGSVHRGEHNDAVVGQLPLMKGSIEIGCTDIPTQPSTGYIRFLMWTKLPEEFNAEDMPVFGTTLFLFATTSNIIKWWELQTNADGNLRLVTYDPDASVGPDSGWRAFDIRGKECLLWIEIQNNGSGGVDWQIGMHENTVGAPVRRANGTINGAYTGAPKAWYVNHSSNLADYPVGHVVLQNRFVEVTDGLTQAAEGHDSERAAVRFQRLCDEEGIPATVIDGGQSSRMGQQRQKSLLQLLDECADAEDAILYDSPTGEGLVWRSLGVLYAQAPTLELDYAAGHIAPPFEPIVDDKGITNDVSITQEGGSTRQSVMYDGPLGVDRIGRYSSSKTLNLFELAQLKPRADWEVHKGTVEEARFGKVTVDLTANPGLTAAAEAVQPGRFITIKNLPRVFSPDDVRLLVVGVEDWTDGVVRRITFVTVPGSPYDIGYTWGNAATNAWARADLSDCTVAEVSDGFVTGTDTALVVDVPTVPWTTDPADLPFDIRVGGAILTVTGVSPVVDGQQGFTVSTTVKNGVVKELKAGSAVNVHPAAHTASVI